MIPQNCRHRDLTLVSAFKECAVQFRENKHTKRQLLNPWWCSWDGQEDQDTTTL